MSETDLDELREQIEERQAKIDATRAELDELVETTDVDLDELDEMTDVDLSGLRGRLDEHEREIEDLRESIATTKMFREALAGPVKVDAAPDDSRGFR
jgi:chromosome segregation ATPase